METMSPEEIEAMEKAKAEKEKRTAGGNGGDSPITKSEMMSEMRCMIQGLMEAGLLNSKVMSGLTEVKLELEPNEVKLEGSRNYLSWSRRVKVLLSAKRVEQYLEESCVEPIDKASTEWKVWHTTNSTIVAWLMASMSPSIAKMVEAMEEASKI